MSDLSQIPTDQLLQMLAAHPAVAQPPPPQQIQPPQDAAGMFGRGMTAGLSDYVGATGRYLGDKLANAMGAKPNPNGTSFNDELKAERAANAQYLQAHPIAGYGSEIAGGVVSPVYRGVGQAVDAGLGALGNVPRYLGYAAQGGAAGAVAGAGNAQGQGGGVPSVGDIAKSTAIGTGTGAALGVAVPALTEVGAKAFGKIANAFKNQVPAMSQDQFRTASQAAYKASEDAGVLVSPDSFNDFVDNLPGKLRGLNRTDTARSVSTPKTYSMLQDLKAEASNGQPLSLGAIDELRSIASKGSIAPDPHDASLSGQIADHIDDFIEGLKPSDLVDGHGNESAAIDALSNARSLWRTYNKMKTISDIVDTGENLNDMNWVKGRFRAIVKKPSIFNRYTPDEQKAISDIARTGTLEKIGKLIPWRGIQMTTTYAEPLAQNAKINALQNLIARGGVKPPAPTLSPALGKFLAGTPVPLSAPFSSSITGGSNQTP